jgi:hypothetical protein
MVKQAVHGGSLEMISQTPLSCHIFILHGNTFWEWSGQSLQLSSKHAYFGTHGLNS